MLGGGLIGYNHLLSDKLRWAHVRIVTQMIWLSIDIKIKQTTKTNN